MAHIKQGFGVDVGYDFVRMTEDTPVDLSPKEYAKPGYVIGYIKGDPADTLGFMRPARVRVHVRKDGLLP